MPEVSNYGVWENVCTRCHKALSTMGIEASGRRRGDRLSDKNSSRLPWLLLISILVIVLDRWSKSGFTITLNWVTRFPVIPNVFRITHVLNDGAAFSLFADSASPEHVRWGLIAFSTLAALAVLIALVKMGRNFTLTTLALALVLGGAIGNDYDRIRFASVIDFLEVHIVRYHWPDFNVADSAIVVGACLLLLDALWPKKQAANLEQAQ
jgi:signal peptidase II